MSEKFKEKVMLGEKNFGRFYELVFPGKNLRKNSFKFFLEMVRKVLISVGKKKIVSYDETKCEK